MKSTDVLRKILRLIRSSLPLLVLSIILSGVSVLLQIYVPILFGRAIDSIIGPAQVDYETMMNCFRKIIILLAVSSVFTYLMNLINNSISYKVVENIRKKAMPRITASLFFRKFAHTLFQ